MKNIFIPCSFCTFSIFSTAQNVGIGTATPRAHFNVATGKTVLFGTDSNGAGSKLIWYPSKSAFRVGGTELGSRDFNNVGSYSFASGYNTMASGDFSTAKGSMSIASGLASTAIGNYCVASGTSSTAIGSYNTASEKNSTAIGNSNTASGYSSIAIGASTTAKSIAETGIGSYNTDYSPTSTIDWNGNDRLLSIGNGTANVRSDALTILKNGNTGIGSSLPQNKFEVVDNTPITKVTIGNKNGFGPATLEFVSDYWMTNQWRPAYIQSNDLGNFTGALDFYTNGTGVSNLYGVAKAMTITNGNVGIGINPAERLDVAGKIKTTSLQITNGASSGNVLTSDANGNATWSVPAPSISYWAASGSSIYNNNSGNVCLGISDPAFPLNFANTNGDKISLWGNVANGNHIGFGVQPGLFQMHSNKAEDDIAFGYGSSSNFTEQMRIKGNGNVGIGLNPSYKLHLGNSNNGLRIEGPAALGSGGSALSIGGQGDIVVDAYGAVGGRLVIKENGNVGIDEATPSSKLQVDGALATRANYLGSPSGGIVSLDNNAAVYIFTVMGFSAALPSPADCQYRRYTIVNKSAVALPVTSGFRNLTNTYVSNIAPYSSVEIISSGTGWNQIR